MACRTGICQQLAFASSVQAQKIEEVLQSVEQNNKELQAVFHSTEAAKMEVQTQNNLEDPSVEYSPFFAKGIDGMASSELVVTQGFDFPTLYAARNRSGKLQKDVLDRQQQALPENCRKMCSTVSSRRFAAIFCCRPRICVST